MFTSHESMEDIRRQKADLKQIFIKCVDRQMDM